MTTAQTTTVKTNQAQIWDQLLASDKVVNVGDNRSGTFGELFKQYNSRCNNALGRLKEQKHPVQGRDEEIEQLYKIMERNITPVALLLGQAGVGKTALVEEFAKQLNSGNYETELDYKYVLVSLHVGHLKSMGNDKMQAFLSSVLHDLKKFQQLAQRVLNDRSIRFILFIDEVHLIITAFGEGTKIGGDIMKEALARPPIRVIAATTRKEYDSSIVVDQPFAERFIQVEMDELPRDIVLDITQSWWTSNVPELNQPSREYVEKVIDANAAYRSNSAEPRKTIHILEDFVSHMRRTGTDVNQDVINDIFRQRYSIMLDLDVDPDAVFRHLASHLIGQTYALYMFKRLLRGMVVKRRRNPNAPIMTALLTGPTGVGKTEAIKRIAEKLYPNQHVLKTINMPDYKTLESEQQFREDLATIARHKPNAVILLDEFEKVHPSIKDSMLYILDEGLVKYSYLNREGRIESDTVPLRNNVIFATTNAGADIFKNDAKHAQAFENKGDNDSADALDIKPTRTQKATISGLLVSLRNDLTGDGSGHTFKTEMLNRFDKIIPYRGLDSDELIQITEAQIDKMFKELEEDNGIEIVRREREKWPEDVYDHTTFDLALHIARVKAKADDTESGGARSIHSLVESEIYEEIVEAMFEHREVKKFKVYMHEDSKIYHYSADENSGGVVVEPISQV